MLSERNQTQTPHTAQFHLYDIFRIGKFLDRKLISGYQGLQVGRKWCLLNGYKASFWSDKNTLVLDSGDGCIVTLLIY